MRCADCGAQWREIGSARVGSPAPGLNAAAPNAISANSGAATIAGLPSFVARPTARRNGSDAGRGRAAIGWPRLSAAGAMLCLFAGFALLFLIGKPFADQSGREMPSVSDWRASPVEIAALSARQMLRDGRIAVSVEGRITNRSDRPMPMDAIEVVVSQAQGHRIYGWRHRPAIAFLSPGQSIRFMTAHGEVPEAAASVEIRAGGVSAFARL